MERMGGAGELRGGGEYIYIYIYIYWYKTYFQDLLKKSYFCIISYSSNICIYHTCDRGADYCGFSA